MFSQYSNAAGQAIVQFATHTLSKVEFAIKFFVSISAFEGEHNQYNDNTTSLRTFLPKARDIVPNNDGAFVDGRGHPMPPCIVMEKGESLDRWAQRNKRAMDPFTCMQVGPCRMHARLLSPPFVVLFFEAMVGCTALHSFASMSF